MIKKITAAAVSGLLLLSAVSCGTGSYTKTENNTVIYPTAYSFDDYEAKRAVRESNPVSGDFTEAESTYSVTVASAVLTSEKNNPNLSPASLYFALALAATGASGETQSQLFSLLGAENAADLSAQCANLYRRMYFDNKIGSLKIANSVWTDDEVLGCKVNFKSEFLKNAADNFYAGILTADFADPLTGKAISKWISDNTEGKLKPDITTDPLQIMMIVNTVYYYDQWTSCFSESETASDTFHTAGGDVKVDFMNTVNGSHGFSKGENFTRSSLSLKNGGRMVFVLPDEGTDVRALTEAPAALTEALDGGEAGNGEVTWKIPKFTLKSKFELTETLKALGVTDIFDSGKADLSAMTDLSGVYVSKIVQETYISINEKGVEAAAYTEIGYAWAAMPTGSADMILDRPFLFALYDANGILLFCGICDNPAE